MKEEKKRKHKKQHCIKSSCKDSKSEYYIPKKRKQKKNDKRHKRSDDEDENDYDNVDGTVESSEESENFDDGYEDCDGDDYDVNYKKKQKN